MTLKECYNALGGDYNDVMSRLMMEKLVQKFVMKFLSDASYKNLISDMNEKKYDEAFREAHTLKGVSQNLSFTKLYLSSEAVTEALRAGDYDKAYSLLPQLEADYEQTVSVINEFSSGV
ncbi:MAG: Hpt domain-containing protein [Ruminococcus sp.]|nr:Hpt domain-containing protein [Ruminococcus sp.]MDE7225297.1 Hpt domain-containing protein [Ruminococcus sp.]